MYYRARYYDPTLGRFISADAIVPEPGNPQSLNRYAYVKNNPLRYVDPSGNFVFLVTVAAGAVVGGLFTTGTYLLTTNANDFNGNDFAAAMAAGIAGGALLGTGIGATAGGAMIAGVTGVAATTGGAVAVGAGGVGVLASAKVYMLGTRLRGEKFDRRDFAIEAAVGGLEGAIASATGGLASVAVSGIASAGSSLLKDSTHNRQLNWSQARNEFGVGLIAGLIGEGLSGGLRPGSRQAAREVAMVEDIMSPSSTRGCINLTPTLFPNALRRQVHQLEGELAQEARRTLLRDISVGTVIPTAGELIR